MEQQENTSKDEIKVEDVENNNGRLTTKQYSYSNHSMSALV